jgi:hypothetical protein
MQRRNSLYYRPQHFGFADFAAEPMLPRGSRISWEGNVEDTLISFASTGHFNRFRQSLQAAGFTVDSIDYETVGGNPLLNSAVFRIKVRVVTPIDYAIADHAFSVIKGIAWDNWQQEPKSITQYILNVPTVDPKTGRKVYNEAPALGSPADANKPRAECDWDKQTIGEYLACQLGFNSTSTATIVVIGALVLIGIVTLKK